MKKVINGLQIIREILKIDFFFGLARVIEKLDNSKKKEASLIFKMI